MLVPTHDVVHEELQRLQLIARGACHTRQWHRKPFKVKIFDRTGNEPFWLLSETYAKLIMLPFDLHLEQLDQHSCWIAFKHQEHPRYHQTFLVFDRKIEIAGKSEKDTALDWMGCTAFLATSS